MVVKPREERTGAGVAMMLLAVLYGGAAGMPLLNWSDVMFRERRTENGEQTAQALRDCHEVTTG